MTRDMIIGNISSILKLRKQHPSSAFKECTLPITFTHAKKEAVGCVILLVEPNGDYSINKFDSKYADIDDPVRKINHATLFDCDDDIDTMDDLLKAVAQV